MAHANEDLVREAFAAFGRGDIDAMQDQYFAPDIRWHFPGRSQLAGEFHGPQEVERGPPRGKSGAVMSANRHAHMDLQTPKNQSIRDFLGDPRNCLLLSARSYQVVCPRPPCCSTSPWATSARRALRRFGG
jgi:hypothetical protein